MYCDFCKSKHGGHVLEKIGKCHFSAKLASPYKFSQVEWKKVMRNTSRLFYALLCLRPKAFNYLCVRAGLWI